MQKYKTLSVYLNEKFKDKILKLPVYGGFSCPNLKGNNKGCLFCEEGTSDYAYKDLNIEDQIIEQIKRLEKVKKANENTKYLAYFQSYTNTYADVETLKEKYQEALKHEKVVGLVIATRPDCLDDQVIDLLKDINEKTFLWLELGFQTSNESTAKLINRGYDNLVFEKALKRLKENNIKVVTHVIFGLPFESKVDYFNTIKYLKKQEIWGIKIHSLYIEKDSKMQEYYYKNPFPIITFEDYVEAVAESLKIIGEDIVIHRLTGDCLKEKLFEPKWSGDKLKVLSSINKRLSSNY